MLHCDTGLLQYSIQYCILYIISTWMVMSVSHWYDCKTIILKDTVHFVTHWGVTKDKKLLYLWRLEAIKVFESPMLARTWKGKTTLVRRSDMVTFSGNIPEMSLQATTEFFVNRLSSNDKKKLAATLRSLNGKTIKIGTTCSGTDVVVPVMSRTFAALSRMFNVARQDTVKISALCFPLLTVYCTLTVFVLNYSNGEVVQIEYVCTYTVASCYHRACHHHRYPSKLSTCSVSRV